MSPARFPSGLTLAEAKRLLIGVEVVAGCGLAREGKPTVMPSDYQVVNVTREALIVAPIRWGGQVARDRAVSILHATGVSRSKFASDVVHYLHPVNVRALQQLLGVEKREAAE